MSPDESRLSLGADPPRVIAQQAKTVSPTKSPSGMRVAIIGALDSLSPPSLRRPLSVSTQHTDKRGNTLSVELLRHS
jgi:hypothetical protein